MPGLATDAKPLFPPPHLTDQQQIQLATLSSRNITPIMFLEALTRRDLITEPLPSTDPNLSPLTLPPHPFGHNFNLTNPPATEYSLRRKDAWFAW
eukprot:742013-Amphidinium_carterae.1